MVGSASLLLLIALAWSIVVLRKRALGRRLVAGIALSGPLALIALEAGWFVTEFGRQPWIAHAPAHQRCRDLGTGDRRAVLRLLRPVRHSRGDVLVVVATRRHGAPRRRAATVRAGIVAVSALALAAGVAVAALTLYAVFGGADFGGGVWDLLASGPRRARQRDCDYQRDRSGVGGEPCVAHLRVGRVFTCFPPAYADVCTYLNAPLTLALLGIVLRGAAFVFRNYTSDNAMLARTWSVVFGAHRSSRRSFSATRSVRSRPAAMRGRHLRALRSACST